ncbi:MAG: phosphatase PAP2 family protein [Bacteroidales bacterium]
MIRLLLFLFFLSANNLFAQNCPYSFSKKKDLVIYSSLSVGYISHILIQKNVETFTDTEIKNFTTANLPAIDQKNLYSLSTQHATISDYAAGTSIVSAIGIQAACVLSQSERETFFSHFVPVANIWFQTNIATYIGTNIAKNSSTRPRPYVYDQKVAIEQKRTTDAYRSFFSQHTSLTAANTFLAAHIATHYFPKKWIQYSSWAAAAMLPAYVGYERIRAGKHFPTDIIAGYIWGAACGIVIPQLHTKKRNTNITVNTLNPAMLSVSIQW